MSLLFSEYRIKDLAFRNRVVMPPMCQYMSDSTGVVKDWHLMHYGARAAGGVGLIIVEATAVEERGRLSSRDLGLYADNHVPGMKRLVEFARSQGAVMAVQLGHGGRKSWGNELIAPSSMRFSNDYEVPMEMSTGDIQQVVNAFGAAARRAREADFDMVEIHAAHGYLIHEFLSPLTNQRTDTYGGSAKNRRRLLLEILEAVKGEWLPERPILVRLSAVDYEEAGLSLADTIATAKALKHAGVDVIDVSSGGLVPNRPQAGPGYQVPMAETVKHEADIPTIAVGLITQPEQAEEVLFNRRADLVALGRELLRNPHWPLYAAHKLKTEISWPTAYERSRL